MTVEEDKKDRGCLFWSAFLAGLIGLVFFTWFGVALTFGYPVISPFIIIPWVGLVITWRSKLYGGMGIILTIASFLPYLVINIVVDINPQEALGGIMARMFAIPFITLPLLSSGILFILFWRKERSQRRTQTE